LARTAELDFVIFGATGFTGRLIARWLAETYGDGGRLRWGLVGRDGPASPGFAKAWDGRDSR